MGPRQRKENLTFSTTGSDKVCPMVYGRSQSTLKVSACLSQSCTAQRSHPPESLLQVWGLRAAQEEGRRSGGEGTNTQQL